MGLFRRSRPAAGPTGSVPAPAPPPAEPPGGGAEPVGGTDLAGGAVPDGPAAWETLPPLTPTVTTPSPTFKIGDAVKDDLVALESPRLTRGMGHLVSEEGPPGVVTGLATIGLQRQATADIATAASDGNDPGPSPTGSGPADMPLSSPPRPDGGADGSSDDGSMGPGTVLVPRILGAAETIPTVSRLVDAHPVDPPARHLPLVSPVVQRRPDGGGAATGAPPTPEPGAAVVPDGPEDPADLAHDDALAREPIPEAPPPVPAPPDLPGTADLPSIDTDPAAARPRPGALGPPVEIGGRGGPPSVQRTDDGGAPVVRPSRAGTVPAGAAPDVRAAPPSGSPLPEMPIIQRSRVRRRPGGGVGLGEPITVTRTFDGATSPAPPGMTPPVAPTSSPPTGIDPSPPSPTGGIPPFPTGTGPPGGEMPLVQRSTDDAGVLVAAAHGPGHDDGDGPGVPSSGPPGTASTVAPADLPASTVDTAIPPAGGESATAAVRPTLGVDEPLTTPSEPGETAPESEPSGDDPALAGPGAPPLPLASVQRQAAAGDPARPATSGPTATTTGDAPAVIGAATGVGAAVHGLPASPADLANFATDLATATAPGPGPGSAAVAPPASGPTVPLVAQRSLAAAPSLASALAVRVDGDGRTPEPAATRGGTVPVPTWPSPTGRSSASGRPVVQRWPSLDAVADAGRDALGAARDRGRNVIESGLDRAADGVSDAAGRLPSVPGAGDLPPLELANAPGMPSVADLPGLGDVPDLPSLPSAPGMPSLPGMPAAPSLPSLPSMPLAMPSLPAMPSMPDLPGASAVAGAAGVPLTEITFPAAGAAAAAASAVGSAATAAGGAPAAGAGGAGGAGGGAPGGGAAGGDLDELAHKLYDRIRWRLRTELRLDRERAGLGAGVRH
jgi:hypothetical protein